MDDLKITTKNFINCAAWKYNVIPMLYASYLRNENESKEDGCSDKESQGKERWVQLMVIIQGKLYHHQQGESEAVDVDNDGDLFGVIEGLDLDFPGVEGHEHGQDL